MSSISSDQKFSMREKSVIKRRTTREHNSNLRAGYVQVNEEQLHKSGLRGRKKCFIYAVLIFMLIIAAFNLTILCLILSSLHFTTNGPFGIEILSDSPLVRFLAPVQADDLKLVSGVLNSFDEMDLSLDGDPHVVIQTPEAKLEMDESNIRVTANGFAFQTKEGMELFSDEHACIPAVLENLHSSFVAVNEIVAGRGRDLAIQSEMNVEFGAHNDIIADSPFYNFTTSSDIQIKTKSEKGIIVLNGALRLLLSNLPSETRQLCLCGKSGKVIASSSCSSQDAKEQCILPNP